ncbi:PrtD family type I secretion system ABC transporter [Sphingomonas jejuensis]|uniref:PrtD family type I secretion system ABC transporter n=1 Tax=Sphingomonas jejuensis TaxID=904715 RepID=A0ABX0XHG7_9SPHN|nr:type I secretion system permease/ATPase [Sphingomonas jejuensis]NJC32759.1 PrtD family type I secretion system ABC transporter [Sphingomonas jejuensis]
MPAITEVETTPRAILKRATRRVLLPMFGVSGVINVLALALPLYTLSVFDRVLTSRSEDTLLFLSLAAAVAILTSALLDGYRTIAFGRVANWITYSLSPQVLERSIERRLIDNTLRTELLREVGNIRNFLASPVSTALFDLPWLPLYLAIAFLIHPLFGYIALAGSLVLFSIAFLSDRLLQADIKTSATAGAQAMQEGDCILRNAEIVDSLGMTDTIIKRWSGRMYEELSASERIQASTATMLSITRGTRAMIQVALYAFAALLVIQQEMTGGAIIAASIIVSRLLAPVEAVLGQFRALKTARESLARLDRLFTLPRRPQTHVDLPRPKGQLSVDRLTLRLPGHAVPILRNVSFEIGAGQQLAIVGPAGSGKTTLARMLIGIARPDMGSVRLDGADVSSWSREAFGRHIGYLPQDVELFSGTVADNIRRFSGGSDQSVINAARFAGCHKLILSLPNGYETEIGEGGVMLSGGQRQQIGLARAVYGSPRFIVLDEPNSNLDLRGDEALSHALRQLAVNKVTVVIITHRPSILSNVDMMLVLDQGAVRTFGPTKDILRKAPATKPTLPEGGSAEAPAAGSTETVQ